MGTNSTKEFILKRIDKLHIIANAIATTDNEIEVSLRKVAELEFIWI